MESCKSVYGSEYWHELCGTLMNKCITHKNERNDNGRYLFLVQDFYVEILGAFIPGFLFFVTLSFIVMYFYYYATLGHLPFEKHLGTLASHWGTWTFLGCLSYAFGVVFYRKPPKKIDTISCFRRWTKSPPVECWKLAVQYEKPPMNSIDIREFNERKKKDEEATTSFGGHNLFSYAFGFKSVEKKIGKRIEEREQENCGIKFDYPYPHLRVYLWARGFYHLMKFVPWCAFGSDGATAHRSKHSMNIIKQRIKNFGTIGMCLDLIRNEGQIRLLSSLWYVFKLLRTYLDSALYLGCIVFIFRLSSLELTGAEINGICCLRRLVSPIPGFWSYQCYFLLLIFMKAIFTCFKWYIEDCMNYVRSREIVMILENAYLLSLKDRTVFSDLESATWDFVSGNNGCRKCLRPCSNVKMNKPD